MTAKIRMHTDLTWASSDVTKNVWVQYTWFNDVDANGRDAGDYETEGSPTGTVAALKRGRINITIPSPPNGTDVTDIGVYAQLNATATDIEFQEDIAADYPNPVILHYDSIATGGANPPGSSNFPNSGTPGLISFGDGDTVIAGDGRLILPGKSTAARDAVSSPETGLALYNTTLGQPEVYNGTDFLPLVFGKTEGEVWRMEIVSASWNVGGGANVGAHSGGSDNVTVSGVTTSDFVMFMGSTAGANYLLIRPEAAPTASNTVKMHYFNTDSAAHTVGSVTIYLLVIHRS